MYAGDDSPAARGARLRKLRLMAGLSTAELAIKAGFSRASISYWENAAFSGLSHKGAEKIVNVLNEEHGINCDVGWLLLGIGDMPTWNIASLPTDIQFPIAKKNKAIIQEIVNIDKRREEIELFTKNYNQAVVMQLQHNLMNPLYRAGDWVGGCWEAIKPELIGKSCIIRLDHSSEVRILKSSTQPEKFNLCLMAYAEDASQPFELKDLSLKEAAVIIRVWR